MYLGIDLGTSSLKVVLIDEEQKICEQESFPLEVKRPQPLWSEQDPQLWWEACERAIAAIRLRNPSLLKALKAIGFSGQMHGATVLDQAGNALRPVILWNDGRSLEECHQLEQSVPNLRRITGNIAMPGFTAPKLLWLKKNEPQIFAKIKKVLLPKDYLRFLLSGDYASDMSDSAGTLWLDVAKRDWSSEVLEATGLTAETMPRLFEGSQITGVIKDELAASWGLPKNTPLVGGGGDNACGAVAVGVVNPGEAFISIGTSGVIFIADKHFNPNPEKAVHTFCHALPGTWHQMSVMLSASSCLSWIVRSIGNKTESEVLEELQQSSLVGEIPIFLPYLAGERTPHNHPEAKGVFFGMDFNTTYLHLVQAVLEGVGFAFKDGLDALEEKTKIERLYALGGGTKSDYWLQTLADILSKPLLKIAGGDVGPSLGAARLAMLALNPEAKNRICHPPQVIQTFYPTQSERYLEKLELFRKLYRQVKPLFGNYIHK